MHSKKFQITCEECKSENVVVYVSIYYKAIIRCKDCGSSETHD